MIHRSNMLTLTLLALALSCGKQGEGERCNHQNGNDDCDTNLACIGANLSSCSDGNADPATCNPDLCCPPAPQRSRIEKCNDYQFGMSTPIGTGGAGAVGGGTGGSAAGGDSSVVETGGSAAGGDSTVIPTDAGVDAG